MSPSQGGKSLISSLGSPLQRTRAVGAVTTSRRSNGTTNIEKSQRPIHAVAPPRRTDVAVRAGPCRGKHEVIDAAHMDKRARPEAVLSSEDKLETGSDHSTRSNASRALSGSTESATMTATDSKDAALAALAARVASLEEALANKDRDFIQLQQLLVDQRSQRQEPASPVRAWAWSRMGPPFDPDSPIKEQKSSAPTTERTSSFGNSSKPPVDASHRQLSQPRRSLSPQRSTSPKKLSKPVGTAPVRRTSSPVLGARISPRPVSPQRTSLRASTSPSRQGANDTEAKRPSSPLQSGPRPSRSSLKTQNSPPRSPPRSPQSSCRNLRSSLAPRWPLDDKSTGSPVRSTLKSAVSGSGMPSRAAGPTSAARKLSNVSQQKLPGTASGDGISESPAGPRAARGTSPAGSGTTSRPKVTSTRAPVAARSKQQSSPRPASRILNSATNVVSDLRMPKQQVLISQEVGLHRDYSAKWLSVEEQLASAPTSITQQGQVDPDMADFVTIECLVNSGIDPSQTRSQSEQVA